MPDEFDAVGFGELELVIVGVGFRFAPAIDESYAFGAEMVSLSRGVDGGVPCSDDGVFLAEGNALPFAGFHLFDKGKGVDDAAKLFSREVEAAGGAEAGGYEQSVVAVAKRVERDGGCAG